jgi:hypothetical protein
MEPQLGAGVYVYCVAPYGTNLAGLSRVATVSESEGLTLVLPEEQASGAGLRVLFRAAWITLMVHSDLHAVGLTAAFADTMGQTGISCNVLAGAYHDHIFVPFEKAPGAMAAHVDLQRASLR